MSSNGVSNMVSNLYFLAQATARRTRDTQQAPDGVPPSGNAKDALDTVA
jgi:hypothetical protein